MDKDQDKIAGGNGGLATACGPSPGPGCWHGSPEQRQMDAESADWRFIGSGKKLHAFKPGGKYLFSRCGCGPAGIAAAVWVDAEPCKVCLEMVRSANPGVHPSPDASACVGGATRCSVSK